MQHASQTKLNLKMQMEEMIFIVPSSNVRAPRKSEDAYTIVSFIWVEVSV
jgi:hypothetical protein